MVDNSKSEQLVNTLNKPIHHLLKSCGNLKKHETLSIICDRSTKNIAKSFEREAYKITNKIFFFEIPNLKKHGEEPPKKVANTMLKSNLIISLCYLSLAHSQARLKAAQNGAKFLSMPFYSKELLEDPSVLFNYRSRAHIVRKVTDILTEGNAIHIKTKAGTNILLDIKGRIGNYCPGFVEKPGDLGSPPDIESNISPIEHKSEGKIVIDGSITLPQIGLLTDAVILTIKKGRIIKFESENLQYIKILNSIFKKINSKRRILAECGIGLNPKARLIGKMLIDEGAIDCMHFGFGSNYTVGGKNKTDFHLDFVIRKPFLDVNGRALLENGKLML